MIISIRAERRWATGHARMRTWYRWSVKPPSFAEPVTAENATIEMRMHRPSTGLTIEHLQPWVGLVLWRDLKVAAEGEFLQVIPIVPAPGPAEAPVVSDIR